MTRTEALKYRRHIESAVQHLPVKEALEVPSLHPKWEPGITCEAGKRYFHGGTLYEVNEGQGHTAQADWPPDLTPSMFRKVNETNTGSLDDPIPYSGNMALVAGLYYAQDGVTYRCTRDTETPVHHALKDLVGLYVETI